jgi:hypothetical protein
MECGIEKKKPKYSYLTTTSTIIQCKCWHCPRKLTTDMPIARRCVHFLVDDVQPPTNLHGRSHQGVGRIAVGLGLTPRPVWNWDSPSLTRAHLVYLGKGQRGPTDPLYRIGGGVAKAKPSRNPQP